MTQITDNSYAAALSGGAASALAAAASGGTTAKAADKGALGSQQFLQLLITQLKNQDPLKPLDPTQFVGQLAQFSTVSGIQEMQNSVSGLADSLRSSQVLDGTRLVGHDVLATGDTFALGDTGSVLGALDMPKGASAAVVDVLDASGQLVRRMPADPQEGTGAFSWDGIANDGTRAPAGTYRVQAVANVGGAAESVPTLLAARVSSVSLDAATNSLTLNTDRMGALPLADVRRIY